MKQSMPAALLVSLALAACADTPTAIQSPPDSPEVSAAHPVRTPMPKQDVSADAGRLGVNASFASSGLMTQQVSASLTAAAVAQSLAGPGVTITNVNYNGVARALGNFTGGNGIIGFESGVILSSGAISNVTGPNSTSSVSAFNSRPGDHGLSAIAGVSTYDAAILEFTFVPQGDHVAFEYVFASDEYPEFAGSSFNDPFAFYVNGQNCAAVGNTGAPVTINNVNHFTNSDFYRDNFISNTLDTEMDGLTVVLVCQAPVNANQPNTLRLAIADALDGGYDSNVFIRGGSFSITVPGQISLSPATATAPEGTTASHTVQAQVRFANGAPQPNVDVAFEVISGPNAGASGNGITDGLGQTTFTWVDANGDGTDVVQASYFDVADQVTKSTTAEMIWTSLNEAPVANAGAGYIAAEGSQVFFDGGASSDADGDALTYAWDFGDGTAGTGVAPTHTYADNGTYTVTLVVNDGTEGSQPSTTTAQIGNVEPTVAAGADVSLVSGDSFTLAGGFSDPGINDGLWQWSADFAGSTAAGTSAGVGAISAASHTYLTAGTYEVVLTVTDKDGGTGSDALTVTVARLGAGIDIKPGNDPNSINLSNGRGRSNHANGTVPVAVLGSADFDAAQIDVASITLGDASGTDTPVALKNNGSFQAALEDVNGDGVTDFVLHFERATLIANGDLTAATTSLALLGDMQSGQQFQGVDAVSVVP